MENKRILVVGGTGYIGQSLVSCLLRYNYEVSLLHKKTLYEAAKNIDAVIYLASVIRTWNKKKYQENSAGLRNMIDVMKERGVKKLIYFSSINAAIEQTGNYGDSKKACEKIVMNSRLDYMIVRPNYVYGIDKRNDFYKFYSLIKKIHIFPIIGNGENKFEPINKDDVSELIVKLLKNWQSKKLIYLSGKQKISLNGFAGMIKKISNKKFISVHFPIRSLQPFKKILPLDLDGIDQDRVAQGETLYGGADIKEDLQKIIKLI